VKHNFQLGGTGSQTMNEQ